MTKETFNRFATLMEGVNKDAVKDAFLNFQKSLEYCIEENNVMCKVILGKYKYKKLQLTGGRMIAPLPQDEDGEIVEFNHLGGLLRSYHRVKQAA